MRLSLFETWKGIIVCTDPLPKDWVPIIIEQGEFESFNYKRFSESDLKDSLDKDNEEDLKDNEDNELSEFEKRLELDYQLRRAFDLVQGVSLFSETQE